MDNRKTLTNHVRRMAESLVKMGVVHAVISPGSRSTPLAYALASTERIETHLHVDERSAGFFALGLAKATQLPVVLLCTSGTAASNYHPAVTEAFYARVPLIVITADRPHELRDVGAPQAIRQIGMFGPHVKYEVDLPIPEDSVAVDDYLERQIARSIGMAVTEPKGPVHLNAPFREPLLIDFEQEFPSVTFMDRIAGHTFLTTEQKDQVSELISSATRGLLVMGECLPGFDKGQVWAFAERMNWPVVCDPLSNLRSEVPETSRHLCIDSYDALLKNESFAAQAGPDTVIRIGPQPVSKPLTLFLKKVRPQTFLVVDESPIFRDPLGIATHHLQVNAMEVLSVETRTQQEASYTDKWSQANEIAAVMTENYRSDGVHEGDYVRTLLASLPDGSDVISGSSMPIRDLDTYFRQTARDIAIFSNRGANGIDGVVSTALGIQTARKRPTWLLIGDLSFMHDVNGLLISRMQTMDLTIIVSNNDGGGIFSYLPQASIPNHFEQLFGTPTGLSFAPLAEMYGIQYDSVSSIEQLESQLAEEKKGPLRIIEMISVREENVQAHRELWNAIGEELDRNGF
ncbi:2-succinyl-5-enolpyruvyl-6-hydroxy-3-cyclohexene-1-carboxylic-acid synthase [Sporosarcina gallistercoris]|uniref:2-succinyl-5-enolpyruvyl-6-hydroxy-3-cyclohexene-1-carboxylate synthase n=1 Tax=Sporosarcina gallistercoris TaxID=2762245 RepID=A0ABR8PHW5_9BACL|nr:2-succinyl-5-enolpyruvyl-6-hydroxy-3-cyclohexene-1-carboxylic-acid synthase [Sporosarcina gallistercoris]MBD7907753.1 2-succinyl-5-enolpyruvyl-6-hydroxy-3-cyclohexene-1-carboxylic-acid synthase [Sporosarcina gallistercoris]